MCTHARTCPLGASLPGGAVHPLWPALPHVHTCTHVSARCKSSRWSRAPSLACSAACAHMHARVRSVQVFPVEPCTLSGLLCRMCTHASTCPLGASLPGGAVHPLWPALPHVHTCEHVSARCKSSRWSRAPSLA